jgi:hypothetical protein
MPAKVKQDSAKILTPYCYDMFTATGANTYQFSASMINATENNVRGVFAFVKDNNGNSSCGWAADVELVDNLCLIDCMPSQTELEALAIQRCEALKPKGVSFEDPCKIFAVNNKIIWDKYKDQDEDFK